LSANGAPNRDVVGLKRQHLLDGLAVERTTQHHEQSPVASPGDEFFQFGKRPMRKQRPLRFVERVDQHRRAPLDRRLIEDFLEPRGAGRRPIGIDNRDWSRRWSQRSQRRGPALVPIGHLRTARQTNFGKLQLFGKRRWIERLREQFAQRCADRRSVRDYATNVDNLLRIGRSQRAAARFLDVDQRCAGLDGNQGFASIAYADQQLRHGATGAERDSRCATASRSLRRLMT
jgi:hypothetical protein